jgi:hypothetical protein
MGYFLTHLLFLDKIRHAPRYELDMQQLRTKSKEAFPYTLLSLAQDNLSLISDKRLDHRFPRLRTRLRSLVSVTTPHGG